MEYGTREDMNRALDKCRAAYARYRAGTYTSDDMHDVMVYFAVLDRFLSKNVSLPDAWQKGRK